MKTEDLLKIVKVGRANSNRTEIFTEFPIVDKIESSYRMIIDKWYMDFFRKKKIKIIQWYRRKKNICDCICHIVPGFHHCWDAGCCKEINRIF
jgi:hypothetical protein